MANTAVFWTMLAAYFGAMLLVGLWAAKKKIGSMEDMAIAGRGVGPWLIALGVVATWINGVTLIANTGLGMRFGLSAYWCSAGFLTATIWSGYYLVGRLRTLRVITVPQLFDRAYGPSHGVVSLVFVLLRDLGATAGVLGAMATVTSYLLHIGLLESLALTFGVTVVIVVLGGMWAVLITDAIQCLLIFAGSIALLVVAVMKVGGFGHAVASGADPLLFAHVGNAGWSQQLGWYVMGFAITCSYQTMIQRGLAARSSEVARKGFIYGGSIALIWYMVPYVTGLLGAVLLGPEVDADELMLKMSEELLNPYWGALMVVTLLAASMSTLDSTVNTIASNFTIDVYRRFINPRASARRLLFISRLNVVLAALVAAMIFYMVPLMLELFWLGGRVMGAALTPVLVGFLLVPSVRRAPKAVMTTLIVGGMGTILCQMLIGSQRVEGSGVLTWSIDPILVGLPISIAVLTVGTWMETHGNDSISR